MGGIWRLFCNLNSDMFIHYGHVHVVIQKILEIQELTTKQLIREVGQVTEQEAIEALKIINLSRVHPFYDWEEMAEVRDMAIEALKEVRQYREIGTVEECLEAREKQKPKAPKDELKIKPVIDCNGAYVDADTTVYLLCPNCGEMVGIDENVDKFCRECGQAILKEDKSR